MGAFMRSCEKIATLAPDAAMGGAGYGGSAGDWQPLCEAGKIHSGTARLFFESHFTPFTIAQGSAKDGLFTGYFEPEIRVSRTRHDQYRTPIHALPSDLIHVDLGVFREKWRGERIAGRVEDGRLVPYPDRAEIVETGLKTAQVLAYAADPVALFFLHIQGSGRALCDDGTVFRLAYAGQNGHVYTAIGRVLIERGILTRETVSMAAIGDWLRAHPDRAQAMMNKDASYIFFAEEPIDDPSLGAKGSQGVALTPLASLAVDTRMHPLGAPFFVSTTKPDGTDLNIAAVAQDRGGAIRGMVRADIYFGGGDAAGAVAGAMKQSGRMAVLLPKTVAAKIGAMRDYPDGAR